MSSKIYLVLDILFYDECDIEDFLNIVGLTPCEICKKGETYFLKEEKTYKVNRCRFDFVMEKNCKTFSKFVVDSFSSMKSNLEIVSNYIKSNNGEARITVYLGDISRKFDLSIEKEAKNMIHVLNADIYFDISYAKILK